MRDRMPSRQARQTGRNAGATQEYAILTCHRWRYHNTGLCRARKAWNSGNANKIIAKMGPREAGTGEGSLLLPPVVQIELRRLCSWLIAPPAFQASSGCRPAETGR